MLGCGDGTQGTDGTGGIGGTAGTGGDLTADAGADQEAVEGSTVTLTGTPGGSFTGVAWTQVSGPAVTLNDADTNNATFTAPQAPVGTTLLLSFTFTVSDGDGAAADTVEVTITSNDFIVYLADQIAGTTELFRVGVEPGAGPPVRLNGPLVADGDVLGFEISPDGSRVVYYADQDTDNVLEVYSVPSDGSAVPVKLNAPYVANGNLAVLDIADPAQPALLGQLAHRQSSRGLAFQGDHVLLAPPFIIEEDQVGELVSKLERSFSAVL